jgi:hypothetical protein
MQDLDFKLESAGGVGCFQEAEFPRTDGRYRYMPFSGRVTFLTATTTTTESGSHSQFEAAPNMESLSSVISKVRHWR